MQSPVSGHGPTGDPSALIGSLVAAGFRFEPAAATSTTVLETFDGRLDAVGLRLDHRDGVLVLHGPGTVPARLVATAPPRLVADLPPGPLRARLADVVELRSLLPLVTVTATARRGARRNADGKVVAAVTVLTDVTAGGERLDGWFVEVEPLAGYDKQAARALRLVTDAGVQLAAADHGQPGWGDVVARAMAAAGTDPAAHRHEVAIPLDPLATALDGFRQVLAGLAETIEDNRQGTIDDVDVEFLHDLRVAVRRSRSVLRHGKKVLPADVLAWAREDLRWLGQLTGPTRDLDVLVEGWDDAVEALEAGDALEPVRARLASDRADAQRQLAEHLRSPAVIAVLERWRTWLGTPAGDGGPDADRPLVEVVTEHIERAQARLLREGRAITPATPAEHVHEVRKDAKRLRYLLECFGGLLPTAERKAFVKRLKALQDNLGEHQDAEVHAHHLRSLAGELPPTTTPETFVALGRLVEQLEQRRHDAREAFAERFADYDSRPTRRALRKVLEGAGR